MPIPQTPDPLFTIVYGPTASGKSDHAYRLARKIGADILSFDSRHVYTGMDIVPGKDLPAKDSTHAAEPFTIFGMDLVPPDREFSIRHYYEYAKPIIEAHRRQHKPLILVGGSWQYVSVLLDPPASLLSPRNENQRQRWEALPLAQLQQEVLAQNPNRWETLTPSDRANPRRLLRALESATSGDAKETPPPLFFAGEYRLEILNPELPALEERIRTRIESRLAAGALEETRLLRQRYPDWSLPAFHATGYALLAEYLDGNIALEAAQQRWHLQERQYAKRQKTWIKKILASELASALTAPIPIAS